MTTPFDAMHTVIQRYIDEKFLCGVSAAVLKNAEVVERRNWGLMNRENGAAMTSDAIFRIYSNTKPITSVAAMTLFEKGCFALDDAIEDFLPQFRELRVLKGGSTNLENTEKLMSKPSVRQLMCHNAGFSYGIFQESPVDALYLEKGVLNPTHRLCDMIDVLADIPLANQPGYRFQYSIGTDILARLIEIWSGMSFSEYLKKTLFEPLQMTDTDFFVPPEKVERFASVYAPIDLLQPLKPGLVQGDDSLIGGYLEPRVFESGGGGLVSTLDDYIRFVQMLMADGLFPGGRLLRKDTLDAMRRNQLPEGVKVELPGWVMNDTVFGLGFAIKQSPAQGEPDEAIGEYHWGGLAGTHSWISPQGNIAGLIFTQRLPGFWDPFSHDFKRLVYAALL